MSESKQKLTLAMGVYDAPESQQQPLFKMNLYRNHVAVFGGFMSGKTTFIKTMLVRLHENRSELPRESIYIIDFDQGLTDYGELPDVCACLDNSNEEDVKRIFKLLANLLHAAFLIRNQFCCQALNIIYFLAKLSL